MRDLLRRLARGERGLAGGDRGGAGLVPAASRAAARGCGGAARGDLAQLCRIAAGFPSRRAFLTELTLDPPQATSDLAGPPLRDEDYLVLSTIHSAKGQEWKQVFVLNCVDGCMPSDLATETPAEIEEERRLLYVAMTRAKDALHLMTPLRFHVHGQAARGDKHVYAARSRFLPAAPARPVRGGRLGAAPGASTGPGRGRWRRAT